MKKLVKATSYLTVANLSEIASRFTRTKAIALILGPAGTGFLAQIGYFLELLRVASGFGTRRALVRQIGEINREDGIGSPRYAVVVSSAGALQAVLSLTTAAVCSCFAGSISHALFYDASHAPYVIAACWVLPVASASNLFGTLLKAHLAFKEFAKGTTVSNALTAAAAPALVWKFGLAGGIASLYLFFGIPLAAYGFSCAKRRFLRASMAVDFGVVREMMADGLNNFYQLVAGSLIRVMIASWILKELGADTMGIYQVVLTLTTVYLAIPAQSIGGYTVPVIAAATTREEIGRAVNDSFRLMALVLVPVIVLIVVVPRFIIDLLYSADFFDAVPVLRWQLVGALFEIVNFSLGSALAAKGRYKILYFTSTVHTLLYLGLSWAFFSRYNLIGLAWGFTAANAAVAAMLLVANRRHFGVRLDRRNWRLVAHLAVWLVLAYAAADARQGKRWIEAAALFSGLFFIARSLTSNEKAYLRGKFSSLAGARRGA